MKKLSFLLLFSLLSVCAWGQLSISGTISGQATSCSGTNQACVVQQLYNSPQVATASATITVSANAGGNTLQFEISPDGVNWNSISGTPTGGGTAVTSTNGTGSWLFSVPGFQSIRVRCSTFVSGTSTLLISASTGSTGGTIAPGTSIAPGFIGPGNNNQCQVDGTTNANAAACAATFKTRTMSSGVIYDNKPYDITSNFFLGSPTFSGTWMLGTGSGGTAPSTANPTCWMLEVPLILPTGADIIGVPGLGLGFGNDTSGATCFMTGDNFPGPVPPPAASTLTNVGSGGSLANGTYYVVTQYTNNRMGATTGNASPGYSYHSTEQSVVVTGGPSGSFTVTSPPAQQASNNTQGAGATNFAATGFTVGVSTTPGQEVDGCTGTAGSSGCLAVSVVCGGGVDTSDANGACLLGSTATVTVLPALPGQAPSNGAHLPVPVDTTSAAIIVGNMNTVPGNSNSFSQRLANFMLIAGGCAGCSAGNQEYAPSSPSTPGNHTPSVGIQVMNAQESVSLDFIGMWGPFSGAWIYGVIGQWAGVRGFQPFATHSMDNNPAYTTGPFYNVVIDGGALFGRATGIFNFQNSSFNYHPSGTYNKLGANVYVRGTGPSGSPVMFNGTNLHFEGWPSGYDNVTLDWGATGNLTGSIGFANGGTTVGGIHRCGNNISGACLSGVPGGGISATAEQQAGFTGSCLILDEPRSNCLKPPAALPNQQFNYDSANQIAKFVTTANTAQTFSVSPAFLPITTPVGAPFSQLNGHYTTSGSGTVATLTLSQGLFPQAYQISGGLTQLKVTSCSVGGYNGTFPILNTASTGAGFGTVTYTNATTGAATGCVTYVPASLGVEANTNYRGSCKGMYKGSATTTTPEFQWAGPASPTLFNWSLNATTTQGSGAAVFSQEATGFGTTLVPASIGTTATDMPFSIDFQFENGANPGVLQLQFAAGGTGTLTIEPGFTCEMQPQTQVP